MPAMQMLVISIKSPECLQDCAILSVSTTAMEIDIMRCFSWVAKCLYSFGPVLSFISQ